MILGYLPNGLPAYAVESAVPGMHRLCLGRLSRVKAHPDECGATPLQISRRRTIVYPLGRTRDRRTNGMDHIFRRISRVFRRRVSFRKHLDGANDCGRSNLSVVSTTHSLSNTVFRRQLNGRAFLSDPDVFFLREDNLRLTEEEKLTLATANALFGGVFFCSDNMGRYDARTRALYRRLLEAREAQNIRVAADTPGLVSVTYELNGIHKLLKIKF